MLTSMCFLERGFPSYLDTLLYFSICWQFISSYYIDWPVWSFHTASKSLRDDKKIFHALRSNAPGLCFLMWILRLPVNSAVISGVWRSVLVNCLNSTQNTFGLYQAFPVNSQVLGWVCCDGNAGITCVMEETCGHRKLNPFLFPRNYVDNAGLIYSWTSLPAEHHKASIYYRFSVRWSSVGSLSTLVCSACSLVRNCFKKQ